MSVIRNSMHEVQTGENPVDLARIVMQGTDLLVRDTAHHVVTVTRLTFGRARINVASGGCYAFYDDGW